MKKNNIISIENGNKTGGARDRKAGAEEKSCNENKGSRQTSTSIHHALFADAALAQPPNSIDGIHDLLQVYKEHCRDQHIMRATEMERQLHVDFHSLQVCI